MKKTRLPRTDSIEELAKFWDAHDLTDFEDRLEEVSEPVFVKGTPIRITLKSREAAAVEEMAQSKGVSKEELVREWVLQKLSRRKNGRTRKR